MAGHGLQGGKERRPKGRGPVVVGERRGESLDGVFFEKEPAWEKVSWKAARYGQGGNSGMRPSATWTMSGV